jgi:hypothetical protein
MIIYWEQDDKEMSGRAGGISEGWEIVKRQRQLRLILN